MVLDNYHDVDVVKWVYKSVEFRCCKLNVIGSFSFVGNRRSNIKKSLIVQNQINSIRGKNTVKSKLIPITVKGNN